MTETPKTFDEWLGWYSVDALNPDNAPANGFEALRMAWEAGHAAGRLEGLEEVAKLVWERPSLDVEELMGAIRALAKDRERA